jgi:ribonuclease BN (tRNA processing enzyme)
MRCLLLAGLTCFSAFAGTQVVILGTGTPRADPDRSGPAVAVISNDQAYLFDAGPGVVRRAAAASRVDGIPALTASRLGRVFLTHLHSDHTLGLPDLIFSPWVLGRTAPLDLFGPPGTKSMVDHIEAAWQQDIDIRVHGLEHGNETGYKVTVHEIEPGVVYRDSGLKITAIPVHHGSWPQAFAYRIDAPDRSIVISGDCSPSPALLEAAKGCDLLLHEVYSETEPEHGHFNSPDWPEYMRQFHTSTAQVAEIANQAKPKLLVLYHQIWGNVEDEALLKEVRRAYQGSVRSAKDLDVY